MFGHDPKDLMEAKVTFVLSPSDFYLRFRRDEGAYAEVQVKAAAAFESAPEVGGEVGLGSLCLARCPETGRPSRARVAEFYDEPILGPHARVAFLDVGHSRWVRQDLLREAPREVIIAAPPLAENAALFGLRPGLSDGRGGGPDWGHSAVSLFHEMVMGKSCLVALMERKVDLMLVDLFARDVSVRDMLLLTGKGAI